MKHKVPQSKLHKKCAGYIGRKLYNFTKGHKERLNKLKKDKLCYWSERLNTLKIPATSKVFSKSNVTSKSQGFLLQTLEDVHFDQ